LTSSAITRKKGFCTSAVPAARFVIPALFLVVNLTVRFVEETSQPPGVPGENEWVTGTLNVQVIGYYTAGRSTEQRAYGNCRYEAIEAIN